MNKTESIQKKLRSLDIKHDDVLRLLIETAGRLLPLLPPNSPYIRLSSVYKVGDLKTTFFAPTEADYLGRNNHFRCATKVIEAPASFVDTIWFEEHSKRPLWDRQAVQFVSTRRLALGEELNEKNTQLVYAVAAHKPFVYDRDFLYVFHRVSNVEAFIQRLIKADKKGKDTSETIRACLLSLVRNIRQQQYKPTLYIGSSLQGITRDKFEPLRRKLILGSLSGFMLLQPLSSAKCRCSYGLEVNPQGMIPSRLVSIFAEQLPITVHELANVAENRYRSNHSNTSRL